ncbi:hypothetical protein RUM43_003164 [Polyplax serrata]|uniref:Uncharacterized protein n=1 Tax=Polyplax serrata TaxID=468196 RepID=A0AAN8S5E3_POLSC
MEKLQKGDGEEKKFRPQKTRQTGELTDGEREEMPFHEVEIVRGVESFSSLMADSEFGRRDSRGTKPSRSQFEQKKIKRCPQEEDGGQK